MSHRVIHTVFLLNVVNKWFVLCLFASPKQESMESEKLSDRQHLLQRLLEAIKQVAEYYCLHYDRGLSFCLVCIKKFAVHKSLLVSISCDLAVYVLGAWLWA